MSVNIVYKHRQLDYRQTYTWGAPHCTLSFHGGETINRMEQWQQWQVFLSQFERDDQIKINQTSCF